MSDPTIATLATSISNLVVAYTSSIFGAQTLTIMDLGEQPSAIDERTCPVMFFDPEAPITNFVTERTGMGPATTGGHLYSYTLNYFVAVMPVGGYRGLADVLPELVAWSQEIVGGIAVNDDSLGVENIEARVDVIGTITDPTGNVYHGLRISVDVEEF